jgi:hypothetical protein
MEGSFFLLAFDFFLLYGIISTHKLRERTAFFHE